jgi:hypothetical protein
MYTKYFWREEGVTFFSEGKLITPVLDGGLRSGKT